MCVVRKNACSVLKANDKLFEKVRLCLPFRTQPRMNTCCAILNVGMRFIGARQNFKTEKNVEDVERSVAFPWVDCSVG